MTLISEHVETDTRERILVVAERLLREIGYQKTTVADIAKVLRMSPANVYRFFDSKKAIHEGVARGLMGGVEDAAQVIASQRGSATARLRELRYMTRGPGAKSARPPKLPSIDKLRADIAKVPAKKKSKKKKARKR